LILLLGNLIRPMSYSNAYPSIEITDEQLAAFSRLREPLILSMEKRCNRANLTVGVSYTKCQKVGGVMRYTDVGRFVRSYRMGSGDGMTIHWEFDLDGKITTEDDEMWGSVDGEELVYYTVMTSASKDPSNCDGCMCADKSSCSK